MPPTVLAAAQSTSFPGDVLRNIAHHLRFASLAAEHGVHVLVFPELSLTGYEPQLARRLALAADDPRLDPLRRIAGENRMSIVVGAPVLDRRQELNIAAFSMLPDGTVSTYTKQHLHPGEERVFSPGSGGPTLCTHGGTVALAICAEIAHPEHAARAAALAADVYAAGVLITAAGYVADAALLERYARDHLMAVVMANHGGPTGGWVSAGRSAIWAPGGALVVAARGARESLVLARDEDRAWTGRELALPWES